MARKRLISPEFFTHEELYAAEVAHALPLRVAFSGLWTRSDRRGLFRWRPNELKLAILPYDPIDFADVLRALESTGFVVRYTVDGKDYGWIPSFPRWQTFHINEKPALEIPAPPAMTQHGASTVQTPPRHRVSTSVTVTDTSTVSIAGTDTERDAQPDAVATEPRIAPLAGLPDEASRFVARFYCTATDKRRTEVVAQLRTALDPNGPGARLAKGVRVRARSPEHLASACTAVIADPPDKADIAIVWVLKKLGDLKLDAHGRAPSEARAQEDAQRRKSEELYFADKRAASLAWAESHPEEFAPLETRSHRQFPEGQFGEIARRAWLVEQIAPRLNFPDFDTWRAQRRAS